MSGEVEEQEASLPSEDPTRDTATEGQSKEQQAEVSAKENTSFEQRYIIDKWIARYPDGSFLKYEEETWKKIEGDEEELITQLWYEQEIAEDKVINGVKHKWDATSQQWIPIEEIDEEFLANYQASYGVPYDYSKIEVKKPENTKLQDRENQKEKKKEKHKIPHQGWIENELNTSVYVSNLPPDIDEQEFHDYMAKCGVIQTEPRNNKPKVKLYRNENGELKGDGRCTYIKPESVQLAKDLLDQSTFKGSKISVDVAQFEMKGDYDPAKKKRRLTAQQKKRFLEQQNKIFAWTPDKPRSYRPKSDCVVILKGLFTIEEMEANAALMLDLKEELAKSCVKYGMVKKVVVYDNNPEGVASIHFTNTEHSDLAVKSLNNRVVDGKLLHAMLWDGKTKYKIEETKEEEQARLEKFGKTLEEDEESSDGSVPEVEETIQEASQPNEVPTTSSE